MKRLTLYGLILYGLGGGFSLVTGLRSLQQATNMVGMPPTLAALMVWMSWAALALGGALLGMTVAMSAITKPGIVRWNSTIMMLFGSLMLALTAISYAYQLPNLSPAMATLAAIMFASGLGITFWTNPYGRPRACPECGARVVIWSKKGMTYCTSCEWYFGAIPESTSVMITGDSGVGKTMLSLKLAELFLSRGKRCIFVAIDQPPATIRHIATEAHHSLSRLASALSEGSEDFAIVDSFSSIGGLRATERYAINQAFNLEQMRDTIKVLYEKNNGRAGVVVMLDSVNQLFMHRDANLVLRFLSECRARLLGKGGALVFSLTEGAMPETVYQSAGSMVDVIIQMKFAEGRLGHLRRFRLAKIRGQNVFDEWVYFEVLPKEGIVFQPIRKRKRSQREVGLLDWIRGPRR